MRHELRGSKKKTSKVLVADSNSMKKVRTATNSSFPPIELSPKSKIGIVFRKSQESVNITSQLAFWLAKAGAKIYLSENIPNVRHSVLKKGRNKDMSLILAIGGDGTYLRAARFAGDFEIPTFGINMGTLGFLTTFSPDNAVENIIKFFKGQLKHQVLTQLEVKIIRKSSIIKTFTSLNDVVVERGSHSQLIELSLSLGDKYISTTRADGFIVATPSGSTAYNLAAGGPIVHPQSASFVLNFVAPHSLTTRAMVVPDDEVVELRVVEDRQQQAKLIVDGASAIELHENDRLLIKKSSQKHYSLQAQEYDFFLLLREKLKFGERE